MKWIVSAVAFIGLLPAIESSAIASDVNTDTIVISTLSAKAGSPEIAVTTSTVLVLGASVTLQGANGHVTGTSSVTASSFGGDGSHLTGVASNVVLSATQAFTAAQTFASSFTIRSNGREVIFSTSPTATTVLLSSAGILYFEPSLHNSSSTTLPDFQTTNTALGPCIGGSTLTITTAGGDVQLNFSAVYIVGFSSVTTPILSFLQDGQYIADMSASKGLITANSVCDSIACAISFTYLATNVSAGSHSYCLTAAATSYPPFSNTLYIINQTGGTPGRNIFFLKELR